MSRKVLFLIVILAQLVVSGGCATRMNGENLGGDFKRVRQEVKGAPDSEESSYVDHLYYRGADLGEVGYVSVAPSGGYAIFERNGENFLIVAATGNLKPVTDGAFAMPKRVRWYETERYAQIEYQEDRPSSRIDLR